jgi:hypothetical protein
VVVTFQEKDTATIIRGELMSAAYVDGLYRDRRWKDLHT